MNTDFLTFYLFGRELQKKLPGAWIQKIFQPGEGEFILRMRLPGENFFLSFSLEAGRQRIHPIPGKTSPAPSPSPFCMLLRKHLEGGRVVSVHPGRDDRILKIQALAPRGPGEAIERSLVIEMTGRQANLIVLDGGDRYVGALYRKDPRRAIVTGQPYSPPPPPPGKSFLATDGPGLLSILGEGGGSSITRILTGAFPGLPGPAAQWIAAGAGISPGTPADELSGEQKTALSGAWDRLREEVDRGRPRPRLYFDREDGEMEGEAALLTFWDTPGVEGLPSMEFSTVADALQRLYRAGAAPHRLQEMRAGMQTAISRKMEKVKKRIAKQEQDLEGAMGASALKRWGELLLSGLDRIPPKAREAELEDYYQDPPKPVVIRLNPSLSASANAQDYFRRYRKAARGQEIIRERLQLSREELLFLEDLLYQVESAETLDELQEIASGVSDESIFPVQRLPGRGKGAEPPSAPRRYELGRGYVALVGRNSRQNDQLTLHTAQKEDIWLHARQIPGSHVILRIAKPSLPVPDGVLHAAAQLAAFFSRGRSSPKVPVDYTRAKNVRKGKGQKAGSVLLSGEKTILVKPEDFTAP
jgi:predicted ribosome quality control (RQC) complex YloA/Tae2 family protein